MDYEWVIKESVWAQQLDSEGMHVLVCDSEQRRAVVIFQDNLFDLLFNGEFIDVGDDLLIYLGVMDAASSAYPDIAHIDIPE
jgi:hypothetical protein